MENQKPSSTLWADCKNEFVACDNKQLDRLLKNILGIVKKNYREFEDVTEHDFLEFVLFMDADNYFVGTNGDDYELILRTYSKQEEPTIADIWNILSQLIWDLTVPVIDKICPFCGCDNIILLLDSDKIIYESCENCFRTTKEGNEIMRPDNLFPVNKDMIIKGKYHLLYAKEDEPVFQKP